ncbi:MAG: SDR family NAD(P)-dependent oxidoreductase [Bacteroidales bacterium]|nr:SDR family NAD(P)-dependent oxidoreductase [Bacteroidales bacterium]
MKKALVVGGSNGIGLAIALELLRQGAKVTVVDRVAPDAAACAMADSLSFRQENLLNDDFSFLEEYKDIDMLMITAGFGRVAKFETIVPAEIGNSFQVNTVSLFKIIRFYYDRMLGDDDFYCGVMGSIAGLVSSPLFALYGATKAAVCNGVESLNVELEKAGSKNRILNVSPGSIKGTRFNGGSNDLNETELLACEIVGRIIRRETLFIPKYEETFKGVIDSYREAPHAYGLHSYEYKCQSGRFNNMPQLKIGYMSGTFDLFHIGHLNLIRRAKQCCDWLVVGVHADASHKGKETFIPLHERMEIVRSIKYVDQVILSEREDSDVYFKGRVKYDFLFVGSDYKGTERFNRYERLFENTGVKIIYFPYTKGTSSTQLRDVISKNTITKQIGTETGK